MFNYSIETQNRRKTIAWKLRIEEKGSPEQSKLQQNTPLNGTLRLSKGYHEKPILWHNVWSELLHPRGHLYVQNTALSSARDVW